MNWIEDIMLTEDTKQNNNEKIKIINEHLGTNFTKKTPLVEVMYCLFKEWVKLQIDK